MDRECRKELQAGYLVSERDYVSQLCGKIRAVTNYPSPIWCHAQTAPPSHEQDFGIDGIMVFRAKDRVKVSLFEAKWPRVAEKDYRWDKVTPSGISHFSDQLERQRKWKGILPLWELFLLDCKDGYECPPLESFTSSCAWDDAAHAFMREHELIFDRWTTAKLKLLLKESGTNIQAIVYNILTCRHGVVFQTRPNNEAVDIFQDGSDSGMTVPLPLRPSPDNDLRIGAFMQQYGLQTYVFINLG